MGQILGMRALVKQLELGVRSRLPVGFRKIYRVSRAVAEEQPYSRPIPDDLLAECRVVSSRYALLHHLPRAGIVAEVGTLEGAFACEILARAEPRHLHVLDIDFSRFDPGLASDPRVTCHQGLSASVLASFADETFDWIYIDADHSYEGVLADARAAAPKLKRGGLLIFNDFAHVDLEFGRYGVHRAAVDFLLEQRWPMRFFALHSHALYDIALEKT